MSSKTRARPGVGPDRNLASSIKGEESRLAVSETPDLRGRPALKHVAANVGLSISAVSKVLSNAPAARSLPEATRQRILDAAKAIGYRPNALARALRTSSSRTIGVLVPELSEGYTTLVLSGIEDRLLEDDYFYFVVSHHRRPEMVARYQELLAERAVEGIVAVDTVLGRQPSIPTVAISGNHKADGVTSIVLDHHLGAMQALKHLQGLGHREIAFIKGQVFSSDTEDRWRSIVSAAKELKIKVRPEFVTSLEGNAPDHQPGYDAAKRLLQDCGRFTALFAFNDVAAIGAVQALRDAGLRVPEDVSVIGFDNVQSAAFQNPGLTTIGQPLRQMGVLAAEALLQIIKCARDGGEEPAARSVIVRPELVVRQSTMRLTARCAMESTRVAFEAQSG